MTVLITGASGFVGSAVLRRLLGEGAAVRALVMTFPAFPASAPLWATAAAFGLSVLIGAIFGVLPARRAARLDPVAALAGR